VTLLSALGVGAVVCGLAAIRTARPVIAVLWLAAISACVAGMLALLGAPELAVIELSVGVGLVTVLLIYGIALAQDGARPLRPIVPWRYAALLAALVFILAVTLVLPAAVTPRPEMTERLAVAHWSRRGLDVLVQAALIWVGALGVLLVLAPVLGRAPAFGRARVRVPVGAPAASDERVSLDEPLPPERPRAEVVR
jgi:NADH:ubiquinone oxidoreductase subunit 6 (subunit J)